MKRLSILFVLAAIACGKKEESPVLKEAFEVHKELRDVQKKVISQWLEFDALPEKDASLDSAILAHKTLYNSWKHDLLEVPGFPHIHLEGDEHDHHHHEQVNLPEEQILAIQKEAKEGIEKIASLNEDLLKTKE